MGLDARVPREPWYCDISVNWRTPCLGYKLELPFSNTLI